MFNLKFKIKGNFQCITMNGDRNQKQREEALRSFRKGDTPVMVVTAVAERGLDIKVTLILKILCLIFSVKKNLFFYGEIVFLLTLTRPIG